MRKTVVQKFRPLFGKCVGLCTGTFISVFSTCIIAYETIHRHGETKIIWLLPALLSVVHLIFVVFSIWKWNAYVYLYDDSFVQFQWGKEIVISYDEIQAIQFGRPLHPYPATITICSGCSKISFDYTKLSVFRMQCTNIEINNKIDAWLSH